MKRFQERIAYEALTAEWIEAYEEFLQGFETRPGYGLSSRLIQQHLGSFWRIYRLAVEEGCIEVYFDAFWESQVYEEERNGEIDPESAKRYRTGLNRLRNYRVNIRMNELNKDFLVGYENHLDAAVKEDGNPLGATWKRKLIVHFRKYYYRAIHQGYIPSEQDLFRYGGYTNKYRKAKHKNRKALKVHEVRQLMKVEFPDHQKERRAIRDCFVFSCMTGLAYHELMHITRASIHQRPDGKVYYRDVRKKTQEDIELPLSDLWEGKPWEILQPYLEEGGPAWSWSNQRYNKQIKLIAKATELRDPEAITAHVARHSAASILLNLGADIHIVQKILGHTDVKTTEIYAKLESESLGREVSKLNWD